MCVRRVCVAPSSVERDTVLRQASITDTLGSTRDNFYVWLEFSTFYLHPFDFFVLLCLLNWFFNTGARHNVACVVYLLWGRYFLSDVLGGVGGSTHGGEIFVPATRIQDGGGTTSSQLPGETHNQCRLCITDQQLWASAPLQLPSLWYRHILF